MIISVCKIQWTKHVLAIESLINDNVCLLDTMDKARTCRRKFNPFLSGNIAAPMEAFLPAS